MEIKRNHNLDLIRLIACLSVLGLHTWGLGLHPLKENAAWLTILYHMSSFAIPFFFMSSGYMLLNKKDISWSYVRKKSFRLLRFACCWNLLWYALQTFFHIAKHKATMPIVAQNLFECIKSISHGMFLQQGMFGVFWYLGASIFLYMSLPLLYKIKNLPNKKRQLFENINLFYVWLVMLAIAVILQMTSFIIGSPIQEKVYQSFRLWSSFQYFLLGGLMPTIIAWIKTKTNIKDHGALAMLSYILIVALHAFVFQILINNIYAEYLYDDIFFIITSALLFSFIMRVDLPKGIQKLIMALSPLTLGVYAAHPLIMSDLIKITSLITNWVLIFWFIGLVLICFIIIRIFKLTSFSKYLLEI